MNDPTGALATALAKVQAGLPKLERDRTVEVIKKDGGKYSYSYVTLANLNDAILPLLAKNGLAFTAMPGAGSDGKMSLRYHLLHSSGESLTGEFPISGDGGIQMVGGRITYARRYVLAALVGVAADEDDETQLANEAAPRTAQRTNRPRQNPAAQTPPQGKTAQRARPAKAPPLPSDEGSTGMSAAQRGRMMALFGELGITDRAERLRISSQIVGRELSSANDLTGDEPGRVIAELEERQAATVDAFPDEPKEDT